MDILCFTISVREVMKIGHGHRRSEVHSLESVSESLILRWCKINKKVCEIITNVIPVITNQQGKLMLTGTSN